MGSILDVVFVIFIISITAVGFLLPLLLLCQQMTGISIEIKKRKRTQAEVSPHTEFPKFTVDEFLNNMEREKPNRFTFEQIKLATNGFSHKLVSGGFGEVYKGILTTGTIVAVKVLRQSSHERADQQFMAEVGTIGRVHHFNLVRLHGFCFERELKALVYEYVANGSLDKYLFHENKTIGFRKLYEIAVGTAKGIAYLHEECRQPIVHYNIKPGNILLDENFCPKVADFGLAKLCNRGKTHISMTAGRGTPGYAAPELWMPLPVTHKCDVYSFGMLLFEIIGKRRNLDINLPGSQEWFPRWVWKKIDLGQLGELLIDCGIKEKNREIAERIVKVALSCTQYRPESRPSMSVVVRMLEGGVEIPKPSNPFQLIVEEACHSQPIHSAETSSTHDSGSTVTPAGSSILRATVIMRKYEIEKASS